VVEPQVGERLRQLVNGYQITQAIYVAVTLDLPDLLGEGPRTAADLSVATRTDPRSLYRLLRALAALGILAEERHPDRSSFTLTEMGAAASQRCPRFARWMGRVRRPPLSLGGVG
jgi:DNA-binding IclR family transcriptional regulator